jgi:hypothetical protein
MKTDFLGFYSQHLNLLVRQAKDAGVSTADLLASTSEVLAPVVTEESAEGFASAEEGLQFLLNQEGGTAPIADAGKLYRPGDGATRQALTQQIQRGNLIAVKSGQRGYFLPVWQFARAGGLIEGLDEVLHVLRKHPYYDSLLPFTFFLQRNPITKGEKPLVALRKGRREEVLAAAAAQGR